MPYACDGVAPGTTDAGRWRTSVEYTAAAHRLSVVPGERFSRPELVTESRVGAGM